MSTYTKLTKHPLTGEFEHATWHAHFYGRGNYGVKFSDGYMADPRIEECETRNEIAQSYVIVPDEAFEEIARDMGLTPDEIDRAIEDEQECDGRVTNVTPSSDDTTV